MSFKESVLRLARRFDSFQSPASHFTTSPKERPVNYHELIGLYAGGFTTCLALSFITEGKWEAGIAFAITSVVLCGVLFMNRSGVDKKEDVTE